MMPRRVKAIGAFTIALAAISFIVFYDTIDSGLWVTSDWVYIAKFLYNGVIILVGGLVIGIATFLGKKWTWKGNTVFQIITLAAVIAIVLWERGRHVTAFVYLTSPYAVFFFIFNLIQIPLSLLLSFFTLLMLVNRGTKSLYSSMDNTNDSSLS